jgi:hypothetical protein
VLKQRLSRVGGDESRLSPKERQALQSLRNKYESGSSLSPDMQRSWDRRERLATEHRGEITRQTPDEMEARFINVKRADAFFDEMATRGFVVEWDKTDPTIIRVQRREAPYG